MARYAGIVQDDVANAPGICTSIFMQGCPIHCKGCQNPETWDFEGGKPFTKEIINQLIEFIGANGIRRDFCIMGGEPLCAQNIGVVAYMIEKIKEKYPYIKIYIWTGYTFEILKELAEFDGDLEYILKNIYCIVDGPFELENRDITLKMRGSINQHIRYLKDGEEIEEKRDR